MKEAISFGSIKKLEANPGLTFESVRQFQVRYRTLYAIVGVLMTASVLLGRWGRTDPVYLW